MKRIINAFLVFVLLSFMCGSCLIPYCLFNPDSILTDEVYDAICKVLCNHTEEPISETVSAASNKINDTSEQVENILSSTTQEIEPYTEIENPADFWANEVATLQQYIVNPGYDFSDYDFLSKIEYNGASYTMPFNYNILSEDNWSPVSNAEAYKIMLENKEEKYGEKAYLYVSDGSSKKITQEDLEENGIAVLEISFPSPFSFQGVSVGSSWEDIFEAYGLPYVCELLCTSTDVEPTVEYVYRAQEGNKYITIEFSVDLNGQISKISYSQGNIQRSITHHLNAD